MRKLTLPERRQLHAALLAAFPDWNALATALDLYLGENLNTISPQAAMPTVVMNLIVWGEARGRLAQVIEAARDANPTNPELASFAGAVLAATPPASLADPEVARQVEPVIRATDGAAPPAAAGATKAAHEALERIVLQTVAFFGPDEWRARMRTRERAVCRIEFPAGTGQGTGFLIGADAVITNYHVLQDHIEQRRPFAEIACRFDFRVSADGVTQQPGDAYTVGAPDWLIASSPIDDLDYAIVRLSQPAGRRPAFDQTQTESRGWLAPVDHPFEQGESIFIIQHPKATPLKVASGGLVRAEQKRLYYLANTLNGSSGSPCFTNAWDLVGLHRSGDALGNVGVPMAAIVGSVPAATRAGLFGS
jgi:hypothetical protein